MKVLLAMALLVFGAVSAKAEWHRAESENFIIYADDRASDVEEFATMLERFHAALALLTRRDLPPPSPSNRLTIFVVGKQRAIGRLVGDRNVAGFYTARASGSFAFVPDVNIGRRELDFSMIVLLHEYVHHFTIASARFTMPRWMSEGSAEFFSSAQFGADGSVKIGMPANHRGWELAGNRDVPIEKLLDMSRFETDEGIGNFYGRSWALYHMLFFSETRAGQLVDYTRRIASGDDALDAARQAFGDLEELDLELDRYLKLRRMSALTVNAAAISTGPVRVEKMSEGMAAMLPVIIRSKFGVDAEKAADVLKDARSTAVEYPDDPGVLAALAEAEYDAGNDQAAIEAADAALARDEATTNAYVQKGYALFRQATEAQGADRKADFAAAMAPFRQLNRLEQDHPLPLIYYYRSLIESGQDLNETARHALERASELAPFDHSLAINVALMQAGEGKIALAMNGLAPVAANPHGGDTSVFARAFVSELEKWEEGKPYLLAKAGFLTDFSAHEDGDKIRN